MSLAVRAVLALAFLASLGVLWVMTSPIGRSAGISNSQNCFQTLHHRTGKATPELLVIGSSRLRRGVDPDHLAEVLGFPPEHVINLAHPRTSLAYDYSVIRAQAEAHPVRHILFEFMVRGPKLIELEKALDPIPSPYLPLIENRADDLFLLGGRIRDQMRLLLTSDQPALAEGWEISRLLSERLARMMTLLATRQIFPKLTRPDPRMDTARHNICAARGWSEETDKQQNGTPAARALREAYRTTFPRQTLDGLAYFESPEFERDRRVIEAVLDFARSRNIQIAFVYLPSIHVPVKGPALSARFKEIFSAPLLIPDPRTRSAMSNGGFYDNNHLNNKGRALFAEWLAREMRSHNIVAAPS
jgi:hypothetical protein